MDWSKLDGPTSAIIFATFFGPIAAVQAQKWIENFREKRREKKTVFAALMYTRGTRLSAEHVQALNRIELAFFKTKPVMDAWRTYLDNLGAQIPTGNEAYHYNKRDELFIALLFTMAEHLGYPFTATEIKNATYRPNIHGEIENAQMKLLTWASNVADGKQALPVSTIVPDDVFAAQTVLAKWLKDVAEGKASIPVRVATEAEK